MLFLEYCAVAKTCKCKPIAENLNATIFMNETLYHGLNDTAVNTSLTSIGIWDGKTIQDLCRRKFHTIYIEDLISYVEDMKQLMHSSKFPVNFTRTP